MKQIMKHFENKLKKLWKILPNIFEKIWKKLWKFFEKNYDFFRKKWIKNAKSEKIMNFFLIWKNYAKIEKGVGETHGHPKKKCETHGHRPELLTTSSASALPWY